MIVTFYSFKGGVGRSMALANIGRWLQLRGLDVVMVDWDLEAPGLESYFLAEPAQRASARGRLGLLDLLTTYKDLYPGLPGSTAGSPLDATAFGRLLDEALPPLDTLLLDLPPAPDAALPDAASRTLPEEGGGRLRLLTAGCRSEARFASYAENVQAFDWARFYLDFRGAAYFDWLRAQLLQSAGADIVLIDARTGVAEMSGICTRQLADVVLVLCAPNDQNLEGVEMMAESFVRPDVLAARGTRRLDLMMVPARIDVSEGRPIDVFEANFRAKLDRFTPDTFRRFGATFTQMRIPYISAYAFAERLAVGEPEGVKSLQEAYAAIATHVALLSPAQGAVRRRCKDDLQQLFGMPTVAVGSIDDEGTAGEAALRARLEDAGLFTVQLPGGSHDTWFAPPAAPGVAAAPGLSVVVYLGTAAIADGRARALWRRALEHGVCLHLVDASTAPPHPTTRPGWPRKARRWNADREWDELLAVLQRPCQAAPVPLLAPPPVARLIGRQSEVDELKRWLIEPAPRTGSIALRGMAGMGKTSIVRAVCNDDDVIDRFDDGVLWATLGHRDDLAASLGKLVRALEPIDAAAELDLDEARRRLTNWLQGRRCILVYDDVADVDQMEMLPQGGQDCRVVMTTSSSAVSEQPGVERVMEVGALSGEASVEVLGSDLSFERQELATLADRLGGSPLALSVASRTIRARSRYEQQAGSAVRTLLRELDQSGVTAIDATPGLSGSGTVFSALNGALELLDVADRTRLPMLAELPCGTPVATRVVAAAASCGDDEARAMLERLATASLVQFDPVADQVRIPPLFHEFLRSLEIRQRRVETTMIVTRSSAERRGIYISYRRDDTGRYAGPLYDRLVRHFGIDRVFMDTASLRVGASFSDTIAHNLERAGVMVVLIGPRWLERTGPRGVANDFIVLEIATALRKDLPVVPVLYDGARIPPDEDLPPGVAEIGKRIGIEIAPTQLDSDTDALVSAIERILDEAPAAPASPLPAKAPSSAVPSPGVAFHDTRSEAGDSFEKTAAAPGVSRSRPLYLIAAVAVVTIGLACWFALRPWSSSNDSPHSQPRDPTSYAPPPGAAEFASAETLFFGRDGTRDPKRALALYRQAAGLGNASAQNSLGRLYELGDGVARDEAEALRYYREAARQGHPDAKAALARLQAPG